MQVLIIGAAGMVGRKLTERLVRDKALNGEPIAKLVLVDVVQPAAPAGFAGKVETVASDLSAPGKAEAMIAGRPDVIFHLAAVVSGEAEADFDKGYRINLDGTRYLIEAIRHAGGGYKPRLVFTSSIAVFGAPFPEKIGDEFFHTPLTSYGTQKLICELLINDCAFRPFAFGPASPTRRRPASSPRSFASRSRAMRRCFPLPRRCATPTRARARRWVSLSTPPD